MFSWVLLLASLILLAGVMLMAGYDFKKQTVPVLIGATLLWVLITLANFISPTT
jgi:hypothetical protein